MSGVLVVLEQNGGKWHRMSWETLAAGQELAARLGQPLEAAIAGKGVAALAADAATKKITKVHAIEHDLLENYTAGRLHRRRRTANSQNEPFLVVFPHTYQVRDFAPKLATRFNQVLVSDVIPSVGNPDRRFLFAFSFRQAQRRRPRFGRRALLRVDPSRRVASRQPRGREWLCRNFRAHA
jgi:electron transfer flavoprotein alpha subunit